MPENLGYQFDRLYAAPIETYRQVNTITNRNAIPPEIRWEGMECYVVTENQDYQLVGGVDNSDWVNAGETVNNPTTHFKGFFNAATVTPAISNLNGIEGDEYKVTNGGVNVDFGAGDVFLETDDILIFYQSQWRVKVRPGSGGTLTANRALLSDASGKVAVSTVTNTELGYVSGVTSPIQTQLNAKLATSSYTAADVLTKLLTVDGSGSGLDADLLDGVEGSSYLRRDTSDSFTGSVLTFNNNVQVRFGNTSPAGSVGHLKLEATGSSMLFDMGASWTLRDAGSSSAVRFTFLRNTGDFTAAGTVTANSFIKSGGTSSQFLKADGSVDSNTYWYSGNDGSGSGLDADLLRGVHWGNVNTPIISTSDITGRDFFSSRDGIGIIEIIGLSSGCIIGTDTNHDLLLRRNNTERARLTSAGFSINGTLICSSTVTATNFILSSDERLKSNIKPIGDIWREFEMDGVKRYGVIAQEIEKTNPELVYENEEGYKSVAYIDLLCKEMSEKDKQIKDLSKRLEDMEKLISKLIK